MIATRQGLLALGVGIGVWGVGRSLLAISSDHIALEVVLLALSGLVVLVGLALPLRLVGWTWHDIGLSGGIAQPLWVGLGAGLAWSVFQLLLLIPATGGYDRMDARASLDLIGSSPTDLVYAVALVLVAGALSEELFFRGFMIRVGSLLFRNERSGLVVAVLISATWFALGHRYQGAVGVANAAGAAILWTALYLGTGSLIAPIVSHAVFDLAAIAWLAMAP